MMTPLGNKPTGPEGRDAVHIAIVAVQATCNLYAGLPVAINSKGQAYHVNNRSDAVGIIDPFLQDEVKAGGWFWLCMFPKTVVNLRHDWEHPAFNKPEIKSADAGSVATSRAWLMDYVVQNCPYDAKEYSDDATKEEALKKFLDNVINECYLHHRGTDLHGPEDIENPEELYHHLSVVTGLTINEAYFKGGFGCNC